MNVAHRPLIHGGGSHIPKRIVVHAMGEFIRYKGKDMSAFELLADLGLSAHALLPPSGTMVRSRRDSLKAWHAKNNNTGSLGVEFLISGVYNYATFKAAIAEHDWVTDAQFDTGIELVARWCKAYDITIDNIFRHSDIDPARKVDPGAGFPWALFLEGVEANL